MTPEDQSSNKVVRMGSAEGLNAAAGNLFKRAWWAIALRGLLAIVLGILMLSWPQLTLAVFISMLGIYLFFDGIFALVATFHAAHQGRSWWPYLLEGLVSVGVGLIAFARPSSMALFLLILVAARAIVVGMVEIGTGMSVRRVTGHSTPLLWLGGLASIGFGILLLSAPAFGLLTLIWIAGIYTIVFGIALDTEAFRLRDSAAHPRTRESLT